MSEYYFEAVEISEHFQRNVLETTGSAKKKALMSNNGLISLMMLARSKRK